MDPLTGPQNLPNLGVRPRVPANCCVNPRGLIPLLGRVYNRVALFKRPLTTSTRLGTWLHQRTALFALGLARQNHSGIYRLVRVLTGPT